MEIRLNKLLSDAGFCSRREADKFIEMGRVTVNGNLPEVGQKVSKSDIIMLDDIQVNFKQAQEHARTGAGKLKISSSAKQQPKWRKKQNRQKPMCRPPVLLLRKKRNHPVPAVS